MFVYTSIEVNIDFLKIFEKINVLKKKDNRSFGIARIVTRILGIARVVNGNLGIAKAISVI